jgi:hypothetical protein
MQTAFVTAMSRKAKNRLANLMGNENEVIVEQTRDGKAFVTSMNRKYHFWVALNNDKDWQIEL